MNKKEYIQPKANAIAVISQSFLDSSVPVNSGNTTEQDAKEFFLIYFDEDEE